MKSVNPRELHFIGLILLCGFLLRLVYILTNPEFLEDGYSWAIISEQTWSNFGIYSDPWGGHDRIWPPLWGMVGGFIVGPLPFEYGHAALRIFNAGIMMVTLFFLWDIGRSETSHKLWYPGLIFSLAYSFHPYLIVHGTQATNIPLGVFLVASALWILNRSEKNPALILSGIALGLACLTRYEYWILVPFIILLLRYIKQMNIKQAGLISLPAFLLPGMWLFANLGSGTEGSFIDHYFHGGGSDTSSLFGSPLLNGIATLIGPFVLTAFLFFIVLPVIVKFMLKRSRSKTVSFSMISLLIGTLIFIELVVITFAGISPGWPRYHLLYIPLIIPVLAIDQVSDIILQLKVKFSKRIIRGRVTHRQHKVQVVILSVVLILFGSIGTISYDDHFDDLDSDHEAGQVLGEEWVNYKGKVLCDIPAVVTSSKIPVKYFIRTSDLGWNQTYWPEYFKENDIKWLVFTDRDYAFISYVGNHKILTLSPPELTYQEVYRKGNFENPQIVIYRITIAQ
jgi:hypothetical protein